MGELQTGKGRLNNSLGKLLNFNDKGGVMNGQTENGVFQISIIDEGLIRIRINKENPGCDFSYAVTPYELSNDYKIFDNEDKISVSTGLLDLQITKNPVRFSFYNKKGEVINEDDTAFGTSWIGEQVTTYKKLQKDEKFVGLGEKTGPLNRKGHGYVNWNTDQFAYGPGTDPLYCSIPFYIGIHNNLCYGIFFDNSHKTQFNFGASNNRFSSFSSDLGEMNYYFIYGETVSEIVGRYTKLTGRMELPPLWSIGYQQCRYSYYPDKEVYSLANTFRDKDIPADVIVFDIHYMDQYKIFTWDKNRFPDPKKLISDLREQGFRVVVICDPGIKVEKGYEPYDSGVKEEVFIKYPDGTNYEGDVWPGTCHFPDFTLPKARDWWKQRMALYTEQGIEGFWNDMNEIATWGNRLPELLEMDFEGERKSMREGRNIYGMQMSRTSFESARGLLGKRPFILTRSGYAGVQRYSAVWTGDNVANDENMLLGVRLVNSLGLSGVPFSGYDIGGFVGNAGEALFARWIQIGSFSPFFRGHSMINSRDSEPWAYGEQVEEIARNYIKLRYKLMNYLYSTFYRASQNGEPVSRSLVFDYPHDENIYKPGFENQYMFGKSFLIAPVESYKDLTRVYLPEGEWYEFFSDTHYKQGEIISECPVEQLPIFVKASAIIPVSPHVGKNTNDTGDILEIHIYNGSEPNNFTIYFDDGESYDYKNGEYLTIDVNFDPSEKAIEITCGEGSYISPYSRLSLILHGFTNSKFAVNGLNLKVEEVPYKFVEPISNFDPVGSETGTQMKIQSVKSIELSSLDQNYKVTY